MANFILGGFKITADGDCSHEIKRCLLLEVMTNLDSIYEDIDISPGNLDSSLCFIQPSVSYDVLCIWASLVAQRLKRSPARQETWVQSLGREDPLEKEMAIHSSILAWRIPWMEKPSRLQSTGSQRVGHG